MKKTSLLIIICLLLSGCVDISARTLDVPTEHATSLVNVGAEKVSAPPEAPYDPGTSAADYTLTDDDRGFLDMCAFVGDSVMSGLSFYNILPEKQVFAQANVAARNIFDFSFNGKDIVKVVADYDPKIVVFLLGMNDLNMTSPGQYADEYKELLTYFPAQKIILMSITPVSEDCTFTSNSMIERFNAALENLAAESDRARICYLDISPELSTGNGSLKSAYDSGDGVHLMPDAYDAILWEICRNAYWLA